MYEMNQLFYLFGRKQKPNILQDVAIWQQKSDGCTEKYIAVKSYGGPNPPFMRLIIPENS